MLSSARELQRAARTGEAAKPLRGKYIGLLCEAQDSPDAELFRRAAGELGVRVARICPSAPGLLTPDEVSETARMLGRLYDAIECQGLAPALVQRIRAHAGVPVYDAIAGARHPSAVLVPALDDGVDDPDNRRFIVQALLLATMR